jgi:hypothetical protein
MKILRVTIYDVCASDAEPKSILVNVDLVAALSPVYAGWTAVWFGTGSPVHMKGDPEEVLAQLGLEVADAAAHAS